MTKITATGCFHGRLPEIERCDFLLITGDITPTACHADWFQREWLRHEFTNWLKKVPADFIIGCGGNHDFIAEHDRELLDSLPWTYLDGETLRFEDFTLHAEPRVPTFMRWAFMEPDDQLQQYWDKIPDDVDVLITHGPPLGILDRTDSGQHVGSRTLTRTLERLQQLKLHVFSHIHEAAGSHGVHHNVSYLDSRYRPTNQPMTFTLEDL